MLAVETTDFSVCRSCQTTFPTEQGWTSTHCSEECHSLRGLPPHSNVTVALDDGFADDDYDTDLSPGEHHCVYPSRDSDVSVLPEDWQDEARYIRRHWRRNGNPFQGCCCGSRHKALTRSEVRSLRRNGFTVTIVTEEDRGCGGSNRGGSSYDFDSDYYDSRDSYGDMDDYDWRDSYYPPTRDYDDHHDPHVAEAMKNRYLAGDRVDYGYDTPSDPPEDNEYYDTEDLPEQFHVGPTAEAEMLEDLGFSGLPDEPEFIFLDDESVLPHDDTPAEWEPLEEPPEVVGVFQIHYHLGARRPYVVSHRFGGKVWNSWSWNDLLDEESFYIREDAVRHINLHMRLLDPDWIDAS